MHLCHHFRHLHLWTAHGMHVLKFLLSAKSRRQPGAGKREGCCADLLVSATEAGGQGPQAGGQGSHVLHLLSHAGSLTL